LLEMNKRALPLTKQQVLQRGNRQELIFGKHICDPQNGSKSPVDGNPARQIRLVDGDDVI
jgi:hypothetical protein